MQEIIEGILKVLKERDLDINDVDFGKDAKDDFDLEDASEDESVGPQEEYWFEKWLAIPSSELEYNPDSFEDWLIRNIGDSEDILMDNPFLISIMSERMRFTEEEHVSAREAMYIILEKFGGLFDWITNSDPWLMDLLYKEYILDRERQGEI